MARKLPWTTTSESSKGPAKRAPAARAPKRESSITSDEESASKNKPADPAQSKLKYEITPKQKKHGSRSPSSSPIRGPPPTAPMRPGYDQDDIYKMVEDELQAVAQTYTHHLHAAEYKRLKKKARDAPPRTLPDLEDDAPKEVKRKFKVMALQDKQKRTLAEDDGDQAGPSDPWQGTSLAGLMGSSSQPKRTLTLSQEIPSSTRAASGYGRGDGESPRKKAKLDVTEKTVREEPTPEPVQKLNATTLNRIRSKEDTVRPDGVPVAQSEPVQRSRASMDNDIRSKADGGRNGTRFSAANAAAIFRSASANNDTASRSSPAPYTTAPEPAEATFKIKKKPAARPAPKRFTFDDDFDMNLVSAPEPAPSPAKPTAAKKVKEVKEENKKTKVNDIPTFLV